MAQGAVRCHKAGEYHATAQAARELSCRPPPPAAAPIPCAAPLPAPFSRFLQGPGTDPEHVRQLRDGVRNGTPVTVRLLNCELLVGRATCAEQPNAEGALLGQRRAVPADC